MACSGLMYAGVPITIAGAGEMLGADASSVGPGDAEVRHQRAAVPGEQDVLRLHVAVDHAVLVGVLKAARDFARDPKRLLGGRDAPSRRSRSRSDSPSM